MKNKYIDDTKIFFHRCTPLISDKINSDEIIDVALFFSLGMEKLLKGILWNINPVYVFKDQSFKNTVPILYHGILLPSSEPNKEIASEPKNDVISFRQALLRTKELSTATNKHFNTLFALSNYRDIIVHQPICELNIDSVKTLLLESYFNITKDYSLELNITLSNLIGDKIHGLEFLSKQYSGELSEKISLKLKFYNKEWNRIKNDPSHTRRIEELNKTYAIVSSDSMACPACGNPATINYEPDFDYSDGEVNIAGVFPVSLECQFCGLALENYDELDYFKVHEHLK